MYSGRDGVPITSVHQTLSDPWYWDFLADFGPGGGPRRLLHDPDTEAFYKRSPPHEMAFSRTWLPINRFFWALGDDRAYIPLKQDAAAERLSPERAEELLDDRGEG